MLRRWIGKLLGFETEIETLKQRISELSIDPVFGMWTRGAFIQFSHIMPRGVRVMAFLDVNDIHSLNERYGYEEVNRKMRAMFSIPFRRSDLVARWFSGDEIVILFDADREFAQRKIEQLQQAAQQQGMSFLYAIGEWNVGKQPVEDVIQMLSDQVLEQKSWEKQHKSGTAG